MSNMSSASFRKKGGAGKNLDEFSRVNARRNQLQEEKGKIQEKIEKKQKKIDGNMKKQELIQSDYEAIRRDMQVTRQEQYQHYYNSLKRGMDCRKEGLIWVIKALWCLKLDVPLTRFPDFLDALAIEYLLEAAKLDIKKNELHAVLNDLRLEQRKARINELIKEKHSTIMSSSPGLSPMLAKRTSLFSPVSKASRHQTNMAEIRR